MKKNLRGLAFIGAFFGLGFAMPSCPGQQALQQQVDTLQNSNQELTKRVQALNNQVTTLTSDMNQVKQLLPQMTNVIQAQKGAIDQLDAAVKELQPKKGKKKK